MAGGSRVRARAQFDSGLIEEAGGAAGLVRPVAVRPSRAIGYREAWAVIDGELTRTAAIELDAPTERRVREAPARPGSARNRTSPGSTRPLA